MKLASFDVNICSSKYERKWTHEIIKDERISKTFTLICWTWNPIIKHNKVQENFADFYEATFVRCTLYFKDIINQVRLKHRKDPQSKISFSKKLWRAKYYETHSLYLIKITLETGSTKICLINWCSTKF